MTAHKDMLQRVMPSALNSDRDAAEAVMVGYVRSVILHLKGNGDAPHPGSVVEAARTTLKVYNDQLISLGGSGSSVEEPNAYDLTRRRDWALYALIDYGGKGQAKRMQLEITDDAPLAVCTGGGNSIFEKTAIGPISTGTRGCFKIFEEATNLRGKKWPRLCPYCQPAAGRRNPYRDARRNVQSRVAEYIALHRDP